MSLTDPKDTLAYHSSRVLCQHRDMSRVPVSAVTYGLSVFLKTDTAPNTVPEREAIRFYGLNHAVAMIAQRYAPLEPLSPTHQEIVSYYHDMMGPASVRAFYYLMLICTREFRHNKSLNKDIPRIEKLFGTPVGQFFTACGSESGIHSKLLNNPPPAHLGDYVRALQWGFYNSSWNGGYGGKAWGQVTDCLVNFITGAFSAEMMMDTIWTLSHNNGPIFNKGHCYAHYTHQLLPLLDVQRSGQIPEAVLTHQPFAQFKDDKLHAYMLQIHSDFPGKIGDYVDWFKVEALGANNTYESYKSKQLAAHGPPPGLEELYAQQKAAAEAKELAAKKAAEELAAQKADFEKNHYEYAPGAYVPKVERAA